MEVGTSIQTGRYLNCTHLKLELNLLTSHLECTRCKLGPSPLRLVLMEILAFLQWTALLLVGMGYADSLLLATTCRHINDSRLSFNQKQQMSMMHVSSRITQDIGESYMLFLYSRCRWFCVGSQLPKTKITQGNHYLASSPHSLWTESTAVRHAARPGQRGLRRLGPATPTG